MQTFKTAAVCLALISALSACSSAPFIESKTGINLQETNETVYTLVNLHPDMGNNRMYSVNYQQEGLIPLCSPVKIQDFNDKVLTFKDLSDDRVYTLIKHGSSPDFPAYLNQYFGTDCDNDKIKTLSKIDQEGISRGEALVGMSKEGVILAIGYPPAHKTPSLKGRKWMYWATRWDRFAVEFDQDGLVSNIKD